MHSDQGYRTPANTVELFYLGLKKHGVDTRLERIVRWFDGYSTHRDVPPALERSRDDGCSSASRE